MGNSWGQKVQATAYYVLQDSEQYCGHRQDFVPYTDTNKDKSKPLKEVQADPHHPRLLQIQLFPPDLYPLEQTPSIYCWGLWLGALQAGAA